MSENNNNILPFDRWKTLYDDSEKEKSFSEYLKVLEFSELISESNEIIKELKSNSLDLDLTSRSKQILKEFDTRLSSNCQNQTGSVLNLKDKSENKIINFQDRLK